LAVAIDSSGDLLIADALNERIREVIPFGLHSVFTLAGTGATGGQDGPVGQATFSFPNDLVVDRHGNIFLTEFRGHTVRKITPSGVVSTLAGSGTPGHSDGQGTAAQFEWPGGIAIDAAENLYVTDYRGHHIRKVTSDGLVTTVAGTGIAGFRDGPASEAQFNIPDGIAVDRAGNLFVSEHGNHAIRLIRPEGVVITLAGKGVAGFADGSASEALFNGPGGIALHPDGSLIVADTGGHRIRRIRLSPIPTNEPPAGPMLSAKLNPIVTIYGLAGERYRIEFRENASSPWVALQELTLAQVPEIWIDPRPFKSPSRAYRAIKP
jgi:sugar lactone lactonase YvrE